LLFRFALQAFQVEIRLRNLLFYKHAVQCFLQLAYSIAAAIDSEHAHVLPVFEIFDIAAGETNDQFAILFVMIDYQRMMWLEETFCLVSGADLLAHELLIFSVSLLAIVVLPRISYPRNTENSFFLRVAADGLSIESRVIDDALFKSLTSWAAPFWLVSPAAKAVKPQRLTSPAIKSARVVIDFSPCAPYPVRSNGPVQPFTKLTFHFFWLQRVSDSQVLALIGQ
jgi:hypothetical protein